MGSTESSTVCRSGRREFLVFAPNWIGDVVMSTPFLALLRERFPDDMITVLSREYVSELLERCSFLDRLVTYGRKSGVMGAVRELRAERPRGGWDAAFVLPMSFSSALVAAIAGSRRRIGYMCCGRNLLLTDPVEAHARGSIHLSMEYAELANVFEEYTDGTLHEPCVIPPYDWKLRTKGYGLDSSYAVLAAGATYGPAKVWPRSNFVELADMLFKRHGLRFVTIGSAEEREYLESIAVSLKGTGLNLAGRSGIGEMMSVLRGAELVVGNDSGPVHVSAAMGVPTVTIFGSTSQDWTAPRGQYVKIVTAGVDCSPCFRKHCPDGEPRCLTDIDTGDVLDAVEEIMREKKGA